MEEESKTKFSMNVEFSFAFKKEVRDYYLRVDISHNVCYYI